MVRIHRPRFHRLLQRFSLTRNEATTLVVLSALLVLGAIVRHIQQQAQVVPPGAYDEVDRLFFDAAAGLDSTGGVTAPESSPGRVRAGADAAPASAAAGAGGFGRSKASGDATASNRHSEAVLQAPDRHSAAGTQAPHRHSAAGAQASHRDSAAGSQSGRVDVNHATAEELVTLPRIGPRMAARIIDFRNDFGFFQDVEDLLQVRGIGEKTLASIRPHVYAGRDSL